MWYQRKKTWKNFTHVRYECTSESETVDLMLIMSTFSPEIQRIMGFNLLSQFCIQIIVALQEQIREFLKYEGYYVPKKMCW